MTDATIDWTGCDVVEIIPGKVSGAPLLKGTRMPVQGVLDNYDGGLSPDEIARAFDLDLAQVDAVLLYRERYLERRG